MRRTALALLAPAFLVACNVPPNARDATGIRIATPDQVTACTPLVRLTTTTGISGPAGRDEAFASARNRQARDALAAGADTLVFEVGGPEDTDALFVEGVAYRC